MIDLHMKDTETNRSLLEGVIGDVNLQGSVAFIMEGDSWQTWAEPAEPGEARHIYLRCANEKVATLAYNQIHFLSEPGETPDLTVSLSKDWAEQGTHLLSREA